tara:strand:- start:3566 stop:4048 length:483 start_codon:yes stop_codon:yes gene_type:complete
LIVGRVSQLLEEKNISAIEAAKKIGISKTYFYGLLSGKRRLNTDFIWSVSQILGVSPRELMVNNEGTRRDSFGGVEITEEEAELLRAYRLRDPEALAELATAAALRMARQEGAEAQRARTDGGLAEHEEHILRLFRTAGPKAVMLHMATFLTNPTPPPSE